MITPTVHPRAGSLRRGYSLVEVLVASSLLGLAMGGAVSMSSTMNVQNDTASRVSIALNYQECAARLWQLGLSAAECDSILPKVQNNQQLSDALVDSSGNSVTWSSVSNVAMPNSMGTVEKIDNTITIRNPTGGTNQTSTVSAYRPTIR
jgi:prepilin-type N-terminal cleavage/methylation domain-containing protein